MSNLQPANTHLSHYPFENVEGNLFPPVCLKSHWDPTKMLRHILPQQKVVLPQDFRPLVKVCKKYVTSGPTIEAPMPPDNMVFPTGGSFYPPGRYSASIDNESILRTLDRRSNKWCESQYIPNKNSTMYVANSTLPDRRSSNFISELSMPRALLRDNQYTCRSQNDTHYFERSGRLFNNPTKQDRYGADKWYANPESDHGRGDPMPHGGVNIVKPTKQAMISKSHIPQPGGSFPFQSANATANASANANASATRSGTSFVGTATSGSAARVY